MEGPDGIAEFWSIFDLSILLLHHLVSHHSLMALKNEEH